MGIGENVGENIGESTGTTGLIYVPSTPTTRATLPVTEYFPSTPLTSPWSDDAVINVNVSDYSYVYTWENGEGYSQPGQASRFLFEGTDEIDVEFTFKADGGVWGGHLVYFKLATALVTEAPTSSFTLYLEPQMPAAGGSFFIDFRDSSGVTWTSWFPDVDINVLDNKLHKVQMYVKMNDYGSANGIIKVTVDDIITHNVSNASIRIQPGEQFGQFLLGPHVAGTVSIQTNWYVGGLSLHGQERMGTTQHFAWSTEDTTIRGSNLTFSTINSFHTNTDLSTAASYIGSKSMHCSVTGIGRNEAAGPDPGEMGRNEYSHPLIGSDVQYYRWWMNLATGFDFGDGLGAAKSSRVQGNTGAPELQRNYTGYLSWDGFFIAECDADTLTYPGGGCLPILYSDDIVAVASYDIEGTAGTGWHEYIVRVKPSSTTSTYDGEFELFVDGVSYGGTTGFLIMGYDNYNMIESWNSWMVQPYFQFDSSYPCGGDIYMDAHSVDNHWNSLKYPEPG